MSVPVSTRLRPLDLVRGAAIGTVELVPGVSGGTVAMATGVYERLVDSADRVVGAARRLVTGPERLAGAWAELRRADWALVVPVLVGMVAALLVAAGPVGRFVEGSPELARGLFLGMVAASLAVPLRMLPREERGLRPRSLLVVVGAAVVAALLAGLAGGDQLTDPPSVVVFLAASVAVCALVLPGLSGSYFLLAVGLYASTLGAVDARDVGYLVVFAGGAVAGIALFVPVVRWLLAHRRRPALLVMTGLMLGSLRALWPWQDGAGGVVAPYGPVLGPLALALLGAAVVTVVVRLETSRRDG